MVWSIIGWTLLGLLALLVLVLVVPAVAYVDYRGGALSLKVRVLFVRLTLYPAKEKKPRRQKKKKRKKDEAEEEKPPEHPERSLEEKLDLLKRILSSLGAGTRFLFKFMRITGVEFEAAVDTGDAADTAIWYGRLQGIIGAVRALLDNTFHIKYKRLVLVPDFGAQHDGSLIFSCKVSAPPVIMLAAAFIGLKRFLQLRKPAAPAGKPNAPRPAANKGANPHGE